MKNPVIDILATIMVMLTLGTLGYWWLTYESDKIIQHKQEQRVQPNKVYEKSVLERYAPKTFEQLVKTTENGK